MPFVDTLQFGRLEYEPSSEIDFPSGLPGFEGERRFVAVQPPPLAPVIFLQSAVTPGLCFTTLPVNSIDPDYQLELSCEDALLLGESSSYVILALLSSGGEGSLTANLLAPVVMNLAAKVAVQAVRSDAKYSHAHPLGGEQPCS